MRIRFSGLIGRTNGILPYLAAPVSFKRLLDGAHSYRKCNTLPKRKGDLRNR